MTNFTQENGLVVIPRTTPNTVNDVIIALGELEANARFRKAPDEQLNFEYRYADDSALKLVVDRISSMLTAVLRGPEGQLAHVMLQQHYAISLDRLYTTKGYFVF